jgi:hypothetical protein
LGKIKLYWEYLDIIITLAFALNIEKQEGFQQNIWKEKEENNVSEGKVGGKFTEAWK